MAVVRIVEAAEAAGDLRAALEAALEGLPPVAAMRAGDRVFLKPNLTYPSHRAGVTTSPRFMEAALAAFADRGLRVMIGESDGGYGSFSAETAFRGHDLHRIAERYGAEVVNLSSAPVREETFVMRSGTRTVALPAVLLDDVEHFVTMPVPKIHAITTYSGAVKNQWGVIPDALRLRHHPVFEELIWEVNRRVRTSLVLADATSMLNRTGPMEGDAVQANRVMASDDILAFDLAVARDVMGLDLAAIRYLRHGPRYGYVSTAEVEDRGTTPLPRFYVQPTLRNRLVRLAFPRQWAVDLLWLSRLGDALHWVFYRLRGNPVDDDRRRVEGA